MLVVLGMTVIAAALGITIRRGNVAGLARRSRMQPNQREARNVVVEYDILVPAILVMTAFTCGTELAAMGVIVDMAGLACPLQRDFMYRSLVTLLALELGVGSLQPIATSLGMVELCITPLFFAVTLFASCAISPFVYVICHMTAVTLLGRLILVVR